MSRSLRRRAAFRDRVWIALLLALIPNLTAAQDDKDRPESDRFRESVSLETSRQAARQLAAAALHAHDGRWKEAVDELQRVSASDGNALVSHASGRYLNVRLYCNLLVAAFPAEGLAAYRNMVDPQVHQWYETGRSRRDEEQLRRVVDEAFSSSFGDDASFLLGEWAFERGDIGAARRFWEQMFPLPRPIAPGELLPALRYPDTNHDRVEVLARLVLCSIVKGDSGRAEREIAAFAKRHPDAKGTLAGRTGVFSELLRNLSQEAKTWKFRRNEEAVRTFGLNEGRNGMMPRAVDVGAVQWRAQLTSDPFLLRESIRPNFTADALSTFPVVSGRAVLFNDSERIVGYDIETGKPVWPGDDSDPAVIYPTIPSPHAQPAERLLGTPRYTMTVNDGRLYARMGSPVSGRSGRELRETDSYLVCLDLERGQGKLVWKTDLKEIEPGWAFEGSPVVSEGRAYVPLRRGFPQTQTNVACLDAETGRILWNRRTCAAVSDVSESYNLVSHHLLTLGDDAVFYSTDLGAVAALDAKTGVLRWVVTYESVPDSYDSQKQGLTPCLFHEGLVVAAPNDFDGVMVLDAATGRTIWRRSLPGGVRHLLGVSGRRLIVSGDYLWALDLDTGCVQWEVAIDDPAAHGYGQGMLAEDLVYWPTREEIFLVELATGQMRRRVALSAMHGASGGNLALADGCLIVAGTSEIVVFGEYGRTRPLVRQLISAKGETNRREK